MNELEQKLRQHLTAIVNEVEDLIEDCELHGRGSEEIRVGVAKLLLTTREQVERQHAAHADGRPDGEAATG